MKIQLDSAEGKTQVSNVRSQITNREDLKKFDTFLSQYKVIDFNDSTVATAAKACCGGDHCCENIHITFGKL